MPTQPRRRVLRRPRIARRPSGRLLDRTHQALTIAAESHRACGPLSLEDETATSNIVAEPTFEQAPPPHPGQLAPRSAEAARQYDAGHPG
jgi:hypothetical protein